MVAAVNEPTPRPYSVNVLIIDFVGNEEREKAAGGGGGCIEKAFKLASSNALLHASQLVISNEREREDRNDIHKFVWVKECKRERERVCVCVWIESKGDCKAGC